MRHKISVEIFTYWERVRGSNDAPLRNLIEPAAIRHVLPNLFILEAVADRPSSFRLAGTAVCNLFGRELRNESFAALWAGSQPDHPPRIVEGVAAYAVPALIDATGYSMSGRHLAFEMVLMPLRSGNGDCDRLLGSLAPAAPVSWLGAERLEFLALDRSRLLGERPARSIESPSFAEVPDFAPEPLRADETSFRPPDWFHRLLGMTNVGRSNSRHGPLRRKPASRV